MRPHRASYVLRQQHVPRPLRRPCPLLQLNEHLQKAQYRQGHGCFLCLCRRNSLSNRSGLARYGAGSCGRPFPLWANVLLLLIFQSFTRCTLQPRLKRRCRQEQRQRRAPREMSSPMAASVGKDFGITGQWLQRPPVRGIRPANASSAAWRELVHCDLGNQWGNPKLGVA